jgi:hypothetical protein
LKKLLITVGIIPTFDADDTVVGVTELIVFEGTDCLLVEATFTALINPCLAETLVPKEYELPLELSKTVGSVITFGVNATLAELIIFLPSGDAALTQFPDESGIYASGT